MSDRDHDRASQLFLQACELPTDQRAAFLDDACAGDDALREEVGSLLKHDATVPQILEPGALPVDLPPAAEPMPERIGRFHIIAKIGEGGMGVVFRAEQREPIRRQAAVKLIRTGLSGSEALTRFATERRAMALMNHPNIARVLDAGTTDEGRPFVAMEYVDGEPITTWCDRHQLGIRERIELFLGVCDGVQHAHQKAIIHRDIKPSNVLVTLEDGKPVPKIIDFGIAKPIEPDELQRAAKTGLGQLVGTPEYMSPEQADPSHQDIDTRTDVYSLGALLYELLTGAPPFDPDDLRNRNLEETLRLLREQNPLRPGTRVRLLRDAAAVAARRQQNPRSLSRRLGGDLDLIVLKSLQKEPAQRYGSPAELAADLRRHQSNEAVLARPPGTWYRASRFARRHRAGVAFTATVAVLLIVFAVAASFQAARVARERDRASRAASTAERTLAVTRGLLEIYDPNVANVSEASPRELLDRNLEMIERELADQPLAQAQLLVDISKIYRNQGYNEEAVELVERGLKTLIELGRANHPDTLRAKSDLAFLYFYAGRHAEAGPLFEEALVGLTEKLGPGHIDTLTTQRNLANLSTARGDYERAERLHRDCLQRLREGYGDDHPRTLRSINDLGVMYRVAGQHDLAEPLLVEALASHRRVQGDDHPHTLSTMNGLAVLYMDQGRFVEAEALYSETLERKRRVLGDAHPSTLKTLYNLACLAALNDRRDRALGLLRDAVEHGYFSGNMGSDPDLASLRGLPEFETLVERAEPH